MRTDHLQPDQHPHRQPDEPIQAQDVSTGCEAPVVPDEARV
jgi:hypothetical protein